MWDSFVTGPVFVPVLSFLGITLASFFGWLGARLAGKAQVKTAQTQARAQVGAEADSLVQTAVELSQGVRSELVNARADLAAERDRFERERAGIKAAFEEEIARIHAEAEAAKKELATAAIEIHSLREQLATALQELESCRRGPDACTRATDFPEDEDGSV